MQFMLDTNVLSELMKPVPDERVLRWFDLHAKAEFSTTAINEAELLASIATSLATGCLHSISKRPM